jgi:hypothetical protein
LVFHAHINEMHGSRSKIPSKISRPYIYHVKFLAVLGAPYIYDISRLGVNILTVPLQIHLPSSSYLSFSASNCFRPSWLQSNILPTFSPSLCMLHVSPTFLTSVAAVTCVARLALAAVWGDTHTIHTATAHRCALCACPVRRMPDTTCADHSFPHLRLKQSDLWQFCSLGPYRGTAANILWKLVRRHFGYTVSHPRRLQSY